MAGRVPDAATRQLAVELAEVAAELGRRSGHRVVGVAQTAAGDDGEPWFGRDEQGWFLASRERGVERWRRRAASPEQLLAWLVDDLVHHTAYDAARRVSPPEVDQRRGWFAEWHRLGHLLGPGPGERADAAIARILERSPFRDPGSRGPG